MGGLPCRLRPEENYLKGARAHAISRSRGGRTTKIHAVTDGQGRPIVLAVTPGNTSDYTPAQDCIGAVPPAKQLIATKATIATRCAIG